GLSPLATYDYDLLGRRVERGLENGVTTLFNYDDASRLLSVLHYSGQNLLSSAAYEYDQRNRRTEMELDLPGLSARTDTYDYDVVGQLLVATHGTSKEVSYSF